MEEALSADGFTDPVTSSELSIGSEKDSESDISYGGSDHSSSGQIDDNLSMRSDEVERFQMVEIKYDQTRNNQRDECRNSLIQEDTDAVIPGAGASSLANLFDAPLTVSSNGSKSLAAVPIIAISKTVPEVNVVDTPRAGVPSLATLFHAPSPVFSGNADLPTVEAIDGDKALLEQNISTTNGYGSKELKNDDEYLIPTFKKPDSFQRQTTQRVRNSKLQNKWLGEDDNHKNDESAFLLRSNRYDYGSKTILNSTPDSFSQPPYQIIATSDDEAQEIDKERKCLPKCDFSASSIISTIAGSILFTLFHIVFCLAQASAIHRPFSSKPVLGVMVRMAAVGPLIAGPIFIHVLGEDFAAVYPTIDVFPAPFFVQMASVVDECLVNAGLEDDDVMFLTTFGMLSAIALTFTGMLIIVGTKVKLVNLSAFLPYPVMCGFFSSVGVLLWTLSFSVDTGERVGEVLFGGDTAKIQKCMLHHVGSLVAGASIFFIGKRNQKLVPLLAIMPIPLVYIGLLITRSTLEVAQENGWFWSSDEITVKVSWSNVDRITLDPPLPFGFIMGIVQGKLHYPAILKGLPIVAFMAFIYFIRCSVHAPALRKNSNNLLKWEEEQGGRRPDEYKVLLPDIENYDTVRSSNQGSVKTANLKMADVFASYGRTLLVNGISGGFACLPSIGVAGTLFKIGATGAAPQYGSLVLLAIFYMTQFDIVVYLPKATFSSLLVVTSIEMIESWFFASYKKTAVKSEWIVAPIIVFFTFYVGSLQSVALGLAISTFIFVGTLNRRSVVKFYANGLKVKSITERSAEDAAWLDQHGDLIQLLVLQSYIFFGNANSCLTCVNSMFEEPPENERPKYALPPIPKYVIIDMCLVSGIDTSSVDVFGEIVQLCYRHECQLLLAGLTPDLEKVLSLAGLKPPKNGKSATAVLHFASDIENALCRAEDGLLNKVAQLDAKEMKRSLVRRNSADEGFLYALKEIDNQHNLTLSSKLGDLISYTIPIELKAGECLFHSSDGNLNDRFKEGGLYFIEHGMLKVERDPSFATTRGSLRCRNNDSVNLYPYHANRSVLSLSRLQSRTQTIAKENFHLKRQAISGHRIENRNVRIARLKPGFVIGQLNGTLPNDNAKHEALTRCRLHHLSQEHIENIERRNPRLILELFKMVGYLDAQRQEATIDQLTTLHEIMTSLAPTKSVGRLTVAKDRHETFGKLFN